MQNITSKILIYTVIAVIIVTGAAYFISKNQNNKAPAEAVNTNSAFTYMATSTISSRPVPLVMLSKTTAVQQKSLIVAPIADAVSRITKKPFGLKVSPGHSPVSPERFSGYHTGVDFETTPAEQDTAVPVYAVCQGKLLMKKTASGYGGVAVQACKINGENVTVIYGHLKISSVSAKIKQELKAGEQLGVLGKGYSTETSGERKHLHLGIHKGTAINILGYVQNESALKDWLDAAKLF
jgi:murein DD-endopeptidase MepM/ murein hydrolase activator NlpD